jgi:hypothetical protein
MDPTLPAASPRLALSLPGARRVSAADDQARACVVYRKGELSKAMMDRHWPHELALPAYLTMHFHCHGEGLS